MYAGQILAGQYTVTWNAVPLGIMQGDEGVPSIVHRASARMVENSDAYGDSQIGGVYRGARGRYMSRCLEYMTGTIAAMWPWGPAVGDVGIVGRDIYELAAPLVLTKVAGQSVNLIPATLTAAKAILAPDFDINLRYGPLVREVALEMILFLSGAQPGKLYTLT
jgi:hypothetical protein